MLLPASSRKYSCVLLLLCSFIKVPPVPSPKLEGLCEWDMLPIKIIIKKGPHYRCLPCRGSGAYARSNIDLVN